MSLSSAYFNDRQLNIIEPKTPQLHIIEPKTPQLRASTKDLSNSPIYDEPVNSYEQIFSRLNPKPQQSVSPEKQKSRATISAIGDAIGALANMHAVAGGAYSANQRPTMSDANTARYNYYTEQYNKERDRWNQGIMRAKSMDADANRYANEWQIRLQDRLRNQRREDEQDAINKQINEQRLKLGELDYIIRQHNLDNLPEQLQRERELHDATIAGRRASTAAAYENIESSRASRGASSNNIMPILDGAQGRWEIDKSALNAYNLSQLFDLVGGQKGVRMQNDPNDPYGINQIAVEVYPSTDEMLAQIATKLQTISDRDTMSQARAMLDAMASSYIESGVRNGVTLGLDTGGNQRDGNRRVIRY